MKVFGVILFKILQPERDRRNRLKLSAPTVRDIEIYSDLRNGFGIYKFKFLPELQISACCIAYARFTPDTSAKMLIRKRRMDFERAEDA